MTEELVYVTHAEARNNFILHLTFNDGSRKLFDMKPVLKLGYPIYEGLDNPEIFKNIELDGWTVTWKNGRADIAPEYLYEHGTPA